MFTAFVGLVLASIEDIKHREVPYMINVFLICFGSFIQIYRAIYSSNLQILFYVASAGIILFGFGYAMYRLGQWGGGDALHVAAIGILLGYSEPLSLPYLFVIVSLFSGALYGIPHILLLYFTKLKVKNTDKLMFGAIVLVCLLVGFILGPVLALMFFFILLSVYTIKILRIVEKKVLQTFVPINKLTEGDWLINDIKVGKIKIPKRTIGLTNDDLKLLHKLKRQGKISKVMVKEGIPYIPSFLIAFIILMLVNFFYPELIVRITNTLVYLLPVL